MARDPWRSCFHRQLSFIPQIRAPAAESGATPSPVWAEVRRVWRSASPSPFQGAQSPTSGGGVPDSAAPLEQGKRPGCIRHVREDTRGRGPEIWDAFQFGLFGKRVSRINHLIQKPREHMPSLQTLSFVVFLSRLVFYVKFISYASFQS